MCRRVFLYFEHFLQCVHLAFMIIIAANHGNQRSSATLIQQSAISWNMTSSRDQSAADHCGAVTLVGSVRTRDLYDCGVPGEFIGGSARPDQMQPSSPTTSVPLVAASLEILFRSNVPRILSSTACDRSNRRLCTRVGRTPRLYAVCSDEAKSVWFYKKTDNWNGRLMQKFHTNQ